MTIQRRFIAGATCPACGRVDKIQRCSDGEHLWMECIACGLQRSPDQDPEPDSETRRIPTRDEHS